MKKINKLFWIFLLIFVLAAGSGAWYAISRQKRGEVYERVKETRTEVSEPEEKTGMEAETVKKEKPDIPVNFSELKKINEDIYAWISIPGTEVDYPVVQSSTDDAYYLDHTIEGAEGLPGSIYTESLNGKEFRDRNTVIYGHNMKDNSMFGSLKSYKDMSYMKEHSEILIYTEDHIFTYRIFGAVTYDDRHILNNFDFTSKEGTEEFLASLEQTRNMNSYLDPEVEAGPEDRLLTLSTCNGNKTERYLIEAVLINEK